MSIVNRRLGPEFEAELMAGAEDPRCEIDTLRRSWGYFNDLSEALMLRSCPLPPLDDLPDHLGRLRFVARQLDRLPPLLWDGIARQRLDPKGGAPSISIEITNLGSGNDEGTTFRRNAFIHKTCLGNFAWIDSRDPAGFGTDAQTCFRMLGTYILLSEYFAVKGFPEGIENF